MIVRAEPRDTESARVSEFLATARTAPAGLVIDGEAGIGKTTFWSAVISRAEKEGFRILSARPAPTETRSAFSVLADLLGTVDPVTFDALPSVQRVALDRVLLRGDSGPATDERVAAAALRSVLTLLSAAGPVLIAIDDLQWLDPPSRTVVGFVARRFAGPIALVATVRTEASDDTDPAAWLELPHHGRLDRCTVEPMSLGALHAVISSNVGRRLARPLINRIHQVSGGNPFYALELARTLDETSSAAHSPLPASLSAVVRQRLSRVDDDVAAVLLAVACSANATVNLVAAVTDLAPAHVVTLVEHAEAEHILELQRQRIHFTHPLLAHGVYIQVGAPRRRAMHRRLAQQSDEPEVRARHLALASVSAEQTTLQALDTAAASATARGAHSTAAEMFELAISLGGDDPLRRLGAADASFRAGALDAADRHLAPLIDELEPGTLRAAALMLRGAVYGYGERFREAVEALSDGVAEAGQHKTLRVNGQMLLALAIGLTGDMQGSFEHASRAAHDAEQLDNPAVTSQALTLRTHVGFMYGLGHDADALATALALEDVSAAPAATLQAGNIAAIHRAWTGDLVGARPKLIALVRTCEERGNEVDVVWAQEFLTMVDLWLGRYADAAATAEDARLRAEQIGGHLSAITASNCLAAVAAYRGREDDARAHAASALSAARTSGIIHHATTALTSLSLLEVSLRNYGAVVETVSPLLKSFDPAHDTEIMVGGYLPNAIEALAALGRLGEAEPMIAALERNGATHDRPWMCAVGARGRAQFQAATGDFVAAEKSASDALRHHERLPMPLELLRTRLLLGQVQRRLRRRYEATNTLTHVVEGFEDLGAELWAARAREELSRVKGSGGDALGLSVTEQRVAELAAHGLSNREISTELYLSAKTVEKHLTAVYRKLGIRSRSQLFARLADPPDGN
ncbi:ATP-binding protein [Mycolicibacterium iranicum]|uniref:ATP-binding protein n=1 Tax=Mycolicibacterium iranicum TaxID=912594 RepID=UPI0004671A53|nr:LuxR family transcriptional regulator [Mycolicibacterium iranicum]